MFQTIYYDPTKMGYINNDKPLQVERLDDGYQSIIYPFYYNKEDVKFIVGGKNNVPDLYRNRTKALYSPYDFIIGDIIKSHLIESVATMQNQGYEYYNNYRTNGNRRRIIDYLWANNVKLAENGKQYIDYKDIEILANQLFIIAPHVVDYITTPKMSINPEIYLNTNEVYETVEPMFEFKENTEVDENEFKNVDNLTIDELLDILEERIEDKSKYPEIEFAKRIRAMHENTMHIVCKILEYIHNYKLEQHIKNTKNELEEKYKRKTLQSVTHDLNSSKVIFVSPMALRKDNFYNQINQYFPEVSAHGGSTVKYYFTGRGKEVWRMKGCNAPYLIDYCDLIKRTPLIQNLILGENCKLTPTEKEKALSGVFIIELDRSLKLRQGSSISDSIIDYYLHTPNVYTNHPYTRDNVTLDMVTDRTKGWYSVIQNELYKITFIPEHLLTTKPYFVANTGDLIGMCKLNANIVHPNSIQSNCVQSNFSNLLGNTTHYVLNSYNPNIEYYRIEHNNIKTITPISDNNLPEGLTIIETYNDTILQENFINLHDYVALQHVGVYTRRDEAEYVLRNLSLKYEELNLRFKEIDYKEKELLTNREISEINKDIQKAKFGMERKKMNHEKIMTTMKLANTTMDTAAKISSHLVSK